MKKGRKHGWLKKEAMSMRFVKLISLCMGWLRWKRRRFEKWAGSIEKYGI